MRRSALISSLPALAAAALFGASAPLAKMLLGDIPPVLTAGLLYLGSGTATFVVWRLRRTADAPLTRPDLPYLLGAVIAGGFAAPILLMIGLRATPAATAALLLNFEAVFTTLIAALVYREPVGRRIWLAMGLATLAGALLSWDPSGAWGLSWMALLVLGACFLWGVDNNFTRNIAARDPFAIVAIKGLGAGTFSFLLGLGLSERLPGPGSLMAALLTGAVCYGFSTALFVLALRGLGAARTGMLYSAAPFIGVLLSIFVFRQIPGATFYIAGGLMVVGVVLLISDEHVHNHTHLPLIHDHAHTHDEHHGHGGGGDGSHSHPHEHQPLSHDHPHTPDLHHRHEED
jgi:drug/metabolite transporter (DMT)-like permease